MDQTLDLSDTYQALLAGAEVEVPVDVVEVRGPDATSYLQGQMSQDLAALAPGERGWSLLLEPTGKLGFWVGVSRHADDHYRLDVDPPFGADLAARLHRFKLRTDAEITEATDAWHRIVSVGTGAGPDQRLLRAGVRPAGTKPGPVAAAEAFEIVRIESGLPRMGAEITPDVIPAELGSWLIEASASFSKGCYTGQELVARIDSRGGNVARHLRALVLESDQVPPAGAELIGPDGAGAADAKVLGTVTSSARPPGARPRWRWPSCTGRCRCPIRCSRVGRAQRCAPRWVRCPR